jgi:hypothetical protein
LGLARTAFCKPRKHEGRNERRRETIIPHSYTDDDASILIIGGTIRWRRRELLVEEFQNYVPLLNF